jgi:hypothetical protein
VLIGRISQLAVGPTIDQLTTDGQSI